MHLSICLLLAWITTIVYAFNSFHQSAPHHVRHLFERAPTSYPTPDVSGPTPLPAWVAVYNAAKAAGNIPSYPVAKYVTGSLPQYPAGSGQDSPDPKGLCSWSSATCNATDDIVDVPTGKIALSFDDGPQPPSTVLLDYLKSKNLQALHFMIGSRIVDNPTIFDATLAQGGALAVHTWSHPYMTTMTDMQVLGELGWTLQIIFDKSDGLLPLFWRPPYGDVDNRVRAIAREVFGLKTVIWNQDTRDWCLSDLTPGKSACEPGDGPQSLTDLNNELQYLYTLPKTPGLMILEHEHQTRAVTGFVNNFQTAVQKGWSPCQLADCIGSPWYQNSDDNDGPKSALSKNGVANGPNSNSTSASNSNSTSSTSASGASATSSQDNSHDSSTSGSTGTKLSSSSSSDSKKSTSSSSSSSSSSAKKLSNTTAASSWASRNKDCSISWQLVMCFIWSTSVILYI